MKSSAFMTPSSYAPFRWPIRNPLHAMPLWTCQSTHLDSYVCTDVLHMHPHDAQLSWLSFCLQTAAVWRLHLTLSTHHPLLSVCRPRRRPGFLLRAAMRRPSSREWRPRAPTRRSSARHRRRWRPLVPPTPQRGAPAWQRLLPASRWVMVASKAVKYQERTETHAPPCLFLMH